MFGIGLTEILILLAVGFISIGIPIAVVVLVVFLLRKPENGFNDSPELSHLREENERLRRELAATERESP